jgi:hypothetical protein
LPACGGGNDGRRIAFVIDNGTADYYNNGPPPTFTSSLSKDRFIDFSTDSGATFTQSAGNSMEPGNGGSGGYQSYYFLCTNAIASNGGDGGGVWLFNVYAF